MKRTLYHQTTDMNGLSGQNEVIHQHEALQWFLFVFVKNHVFAFWAFIFTLKVTLNNQIITRKWIILSIHIKRCIILVRICICKESDFVF